MSRFKNILLYAPADVPLEPAMQYAIRLARKNGGAITIVDCIEPTPVIAKALLPGSWNLESVISHDRQAQLKQLTDQLNEQGIRAAPKILVGRPAMEITREVLRSGHDLVIKTAQGAANHHEQALFGTAAIQLMRICPCPICVVDPADDGRFDRILAAVDPQTDDPEHCKLNEKVLELAVSMGECERTQVDVLAIWSAFAESIVHIKMSDEEVQAYVDRSRSGAQEHLNKLLAPFASRIDPRCVHLVQGEPDRVILDFTQQQKIDTVVMGTVAREGLPGMLMGNTAESVIHKVHCSLLAVKLDTFVSPVKLD